KPARIDHGNVEHAKTTADDGFHKAADGSKGEERCGLGRQ
ncbi:unnamed protein product, partial [marine sediment metagenome]